MKLDVLEELHAQIELLDHQQLENIFQAVKAMLPGKLSSNPLRNVVFPKSVWSKSDICQFERTRDELNQNWQMEDK